MTLWVVKAYAGQKEPCFTLCDWSQIMSMSNIELFRCNGLLSGEKAGCTCRGDLRISTGFDEHLWTLYSTMHLHRAPTFYHIQHKFGIVEEIVMFYIHWSNDDTIVLFYIHQFSRPYNWGSAATYPLIGESGAGVVMPMKHTTGVFIIIHG